MDGMNRGKRLGGATSPHDDVALPPSCIKVLGALRIFAHPHSLGSKDPKLQAKAHKTKNRKLARPGAEAWAWAGQIHNNNNIVVTTTTTAAKAGCAGFPSKREAGQQNRQQG